MSLKEKDTFHMCQNKPNSRQLNTARQVDLPISDLSMMLIPEHHTNRPTLDPDLHSEPSEQEPTLNPKAWVVTEVELTPWEPPREPPLEPPWVRHMAQAIEPPNLQ